MLNSLMTKLLISVVCLFFLISCNHDKQTDVIEKDLDGFRGLRWGTKLSSLNQMTCVNNADAPAYKEYKLCTNNDEALELGGAKLKSIQYIFLKEELLEVIIQSNTNNSDALKRVLLEKLGTPTEVEENNKSAIYHWKRAKTDVLFEISDEKGFLTLNDINAEHKREEYKSEIAKKGAEKDF